MALARLLLALLCTVGPSAVSSMKASGVASATVGDTLFYLSNFVVGNPGEATVAWDVTGMVNGTVDIAAYRQEDWAVAKGTSCDCACKLALAWRNTSEPLASAPTVGETGRFTVAHADEIDYYYIALVLCGTDASASLRWDVHVTFTDTGHAELDYAAVGLPEAYASAAALAAFLLVATAWQHRWWGSHGWAATPAPVAWLAGALALWLLSASLSTAHWLLYTFDGRGFLNLEPAARAVEVLSRLLFVGVCLMLARGWAVTRTYTRHGDTVGVGVVLAALLAGYCAVCREWWVDYPPDTTVYDYDTLAGVVTCGLHCAAGAWFLLELLYRCRDNQLSWKKRHFLAVMPPFALVLFGLPVAVLSGVQLPQWDETRVVESALQAITGTTFVLAAVLLMRPAAAAALFFPPGASAAAYAAGGAGRPRTARRTLRAGWLQVDARSADRARLLGGSGAGGYGAVAVMYDVDAGGVAPLDSDGGGMGGGGLLLGGAGVYDDYGSASPTCSSLQLEMSGSIKPVDRARAPSRAGGGAGAGATRGGSFLWAGAAAAAAHPRPRSFLQRMMAGSGAAGGGEEQLSDADGGGAMWDPRQLHTAVQRAAGVAVPSPGLLLPPSPPLAREASRRGGALQVTLLGVEAAASPLSPPGSPPATMARMTRSGVAAGGGLPGGLPRTLSGVSRPPAALGAPGDGGGGGSSLVISEPLLPRLVSPSRSQQRQPLVAVLGGTRT